MKLNDIVMASTQDTKIRVVVKLYGTSFRTEHFSEQARRCLLYSGIVGRKVYKERHTENTCRR